MFAVTYRYKVPQHAIEEYLALQEEVAGHYLSAGCLRVQILRPAQDDGEWQELSFFTDQKAFAKAEALLDERGVLDDAFSRFIALTGLSESDLSPVCYTVAKVVDLESIEQE